MADDGKVTFLVMATLESPNRWDRPFFVRAASIAEAYAEVIKDAMFQHPNIRLQAYVVSVEQIPDMQLLLKQVAQQYWNAGREAEANPNHDVTFEDYWEENGIDTEEA